MQQVFEQVVHPMATPGTPGAFSDGLRLMAVDGTLLDLPDSVANACVFGYPSTCFGNPCSLSQSATGEAQGSVNELLFSSKSPYQTDFGTD